MKDDQLIKKIEEIDASLNDWYLSVPVDQKTIRNWKVIYELA